MEKVVHKIDTFVDFTGKTRQVIMAAVSAEINGYTSVSNGHWMDYTDVIKEVRLGVSVQSPADREENTELGKIIAIGKAKKDKSCRGKLFSTDKGFINTKLVSAFLDQEMEYFKQNPGKYIKGYDKDKELWKNYPFMYAHKYNL